MFKLASSTLFKLASSTMFKSVNKQKQAVRFYACTEVALTGVARLPITRWRRYAVSESPPVYYCKSTEIIK